MECFLSSLDSRYEGSDMEKIPFTQRGFNDLDEELKKLKVRIGPLL